ncbi:hypothetical protein [Rhodopirellula europaea]|jgi:hypothetical protein|uniref:hypothetical protein n=1 Tax=Rhodopirellula europaea TaxID=1263866 RepID=UPI003D270BAE
MTRYTVICLLLAVLISSATYATVTHFQDANTRYFIVPEGTFLYRIDRRTGKVDVSRAITRDGDNRFTMAPFTEIGER